ncbi:DUF885 family protein [Sphingomonas sp. G-3-2-10]|uniref:DUF885 domain-containing protein n=1 Tax=Sphingomonas sp. G-3-2-10 TaxID=2728838 RepID=UPI00146B6141|nr:DUF885 family protein [Sphingomonas sp. G-3-2-10]NML07084.1 DUF885 family protein [Sphingomonas sp. G-3-2-10]
MDRRSFLHTGSAAAALSLAPYAARAAASGDDAKLNAAFDAAFRAGILASPEAATQLGLDKGADAGLKHKLSDRTAAARKRNLERTRWAIGAIEAIDPAGLSAQSKLDREVVLYSLNGRTVAPEKFGLDSAVRPFTIFQQGGAYFSTPDFLNSAHTVTNAEDAEAYLDRLSAFATVLDQETHEQEADAAGGVVAPGFCLELTLGQMEALRKPAAGDSGLTRSLVRRTKDIPGDWEARATKIVAEKVYPALDRQYALIQKLRAKGRTSAGVWDIPQGEAIYAAALESSTTTKFTAAEVHEMGLEQVASITAELDSILKAQGMTQGSVAERLTALNVKPEQVYPDTAEGRVELIASLNRDLERVTGLLPKAFLNVTKAPLEIRAVPVEIQDGASNGYYRRAALDGSRPAIYFINLKSVGDWPKYTLPSLTYHEGHPGHHLQISTSQEAEGPLIRKTTFFGAYSEGWALYAEQVADELGAYQSPLERAGYLQSFLFRAARLVIDTGIHTKRWSREQATDYMVRTVGFARPRSQREVERYCTAPGQACSYKIGHISWVRAREKAQRIAGGKFDLKQFHEVIRAGAVPLTILERLVEERARSWA